MSKACGYGRGTYIVPRTLYHRPRRHIHADGQAQPLRSRSQSAPRSTDKPISNVPPANQPPTARRAAMLQPAAQTLCRASQRRGSAREREGAREGRKTASEPEHWSRHGLGAARVLQKRPPSGDIGILQRPLIVCSGPRARVRKRIVANLGANASRAYESHATPRRHWYNSTYARRCNTRGARFLSHYLQPPARGRFCTVVTQRRPDALLLLPLRDVAILKLS